MVVDRGEVMFWNFTKNNTSYYNDAATNPTANNVGTSTTNKDTSWWDQEEVDDDSITAAATATATATTPLTDTQEIILSSISIVTGTLSVLGSSMIIMMVLTSPRKTSYKRLLLGLSGTDAIASITFAITPFLLPSDSSHRVWASGNDNTCSFLGFLYQFSFCPVWYNGMLSYYYLFTIRYGVSQTMFARKYEPWMHILSLGFCFISAAVGWGIGLYSEFLLTQGCGIGEYPDGCNDNNTCIGHIIAWVFNGAPNIFMFLSVIVNNVVILRFVKRTTAKLAKFGGPGNNRNKQQEKKVKAVARQAIFYVASFMLSYAWMMVLRTLASVNMTDESKLYPLLVLQSIFHPLQGLTNCFVYSRPNYMRNRQQFPDKGRWWALKRVWFEKRKRNPDTARMNMNIARPTNRGSSWFPTSGPSGTTEWFARRSSHLSSHVSSVLGLSNRRRSSAVTNPRFPHSNSKTPIMQDFSMLVHPAVNINHPRENDDDDRILSAMDDVQSEPLEGGGNNNNNNNNSLNLLHSSGGRLSCDESVSRGLLSSLGDILEEGEEMDNGGDNDNGHNEEEDWTRRKEKDDAEEELDTSAEGFTRKLSPKNLEAMLEQSASNNFNSNGIRRALSQEQVDAAAGDGDYLNQSNAQSHLGSSHHQSDMGQSARSLELSQALSSVKSWKEETLAEKLHRSFGGKTEDYAASMSKNELKDVMELVRQLNDQNNVTEEDNNSCCDCGFDYESNSEY